MQPRPMRKIPVPQDNIETLFGSYDENLRQLESTFGVRIRTQGHDLFVDGPLVADTRMVGEKAHDVGRHPRVAAIRGAFQPEVERAGLHQRGLPLQQLLYLPPVLFRQIFVLVFRIRVLLFLSFV